MQKSDNSFSISYSGKQDEELSIIKAKYMKTDDDRRIKEVKHLDKSTEDFATVVSIFIGMIGALLLSGGICVLFYSSAELLSGIKLFAIIVIVIGIIVCSATPFLHCFVLERRKEQITPRILELIREIEESGR